MSKEKLIELRNNLEWIVNKVNNKEVSDNVNAPFFFNQRDGLKYFLPFEYTEGIDVLEIKFNAKD